MAYISAKRVPSSHSGLSLGERVPNQHSGADYAVTAVSNPYGCNETNVISQYRRPLPATNLPFLSAVMFDGRESTPLTGTTKILYANYPASLESDLAHQALDATVTHAQGDGAGRRRQNSRRSSISRRRYSQLNPSASSLGLSTPRAATAAQYRWLRCRSSSASTRASTLYSRTVRNSREA